MTHITALPDPRAESRKAQERIQDAIIPLGRVSEHFPLLRRELDEELGVQVEVGELIGESVHTDQWGALRLVAYQCDLPAAEPEAREHTELRWVNRHQMWELAWAAADVPLLDAIARRL